MTFTPGSAPHGYRAADDTAPPAFAVPPSRVAQRLRIAAAIGFPLLGVALLLVAGYFLAFLGAGFTIGGAVLALFPLAAVLLGVWWIDRWEPEPRWLLVAGFLWGATVSVIGALVVDSGVQAVIAASGGSSDATLAFQLTVQAPVVEEVLKGLGVLLIFLIARAHFDGPVDGIVYGAIVAGGFAFTENIQYFGLQLLSDGGVGVGTGIVFFMRGILSPFAHVMFTAMTGLAIGIAARHGGRWAGVLAFVIGLIPAMLLHALWNGSTFFTDNFFGFYLLVQVPMFVAGIVAVSLLRRREAVLTRARLGEYAQAGWINPVEIASLGTAPGRRASLAWAKRAGLGDAMKEYIRVATRLASTRQRILTGRDVESGQQEEARLLHRLGESRRALLAGVPTAPRLQAGVRPRSQ